MKTARTDKRVERTRHTLQQALLALMVERSYERLTVQQILDRASVGRATFYAHFRDKEELLRSSLDRLREHLNEALVASNTEGASRRDPLGFSLAFFEHVDGHRKLYRAIVGRESGMIVEKQMRRMLSELILAGLVRGSRERRPGGTPAVAHLAAEYVAGAMMALVTWWLGRNVRLTPVEVNRAFLCMTNPALKAIAGFNSDSAPFS